MRYFRYYFLIIVLAAVGVVLVTCKQTNRSQQRARINEEPPLLLDEPPLLLDEPPLLLDEPPLLLEDTEEELPPPDGPVADNSRCHVCHINYADEELALLHARANVGCERCHGASDAHCNDEDNITPPDTMYPLAKINPSCMECHPKDKIDTQQHELVLASTATENKYCTDCHGEHRLGYRTRKWDKATGELIEDDKVRMMTDDMLEQK